MRSSFLSLIASGLEHVDRVSSIGLFALTERQITAGLSEYLTARGVPTAHQQRYPATQHIVDLLVDGNHFVELKKATPVDERGRGRGLSLARIVSSYPVNESAIADCGKLTSHLPDSAKKSMVLVGFDTDIAPIDELFAQFEWAANRKYQVAPLGQMAFKLKTDRFTRGVVGLWRVGASTSRLAA